jgi:hypothetical protein
LDKERKKSIGRVRIMIKEEILKQVQDNISNDVPSTPREEGQG